MKVPRLFFQAIQLHKTRINKWSNLNNVLAINMHIYNFNAKISFWRTPTVDTTEQATTLCQTDQLSTTEIYVSLALMVHFPQHTAPLCIHRLSGQNWIIIHEQRENSARIMVCLILAEVYNLLLRKLPAKKIITSLI